MISANMDESPVQSGSKSGSSDFSIERLLSDDTRSSQEESVGVPDWLCCTRYRPPRLPRVPAVSRARRAGRHARVPFTAAQASALEAAYARAPYLAPPALRALAAALQLRDDRIKIWFQNRRARERREKSVNIAPPHEVTLPPTRAAATFTANPWSERLTGGKETDIPRVSRFNGNPNFTNMPSLGDAVRFIHQKTGQGHFHSRFAEESEDEKSDEGHLDIETVDD